MQLLATSSAEHAAEADGGRRGRSSRSQAGMEEGRCRQRLTFLTLGYSPSTAASALWSHMPLPNAAVPMELCHSCTTIRMLKNDEIGTHNRAGALQSSHRSTGTRTHTAHTHTHTQHIHTAHTAHTALSLTHTDGWTHRPRPRRPSPRTSSHLQAKACRRLSTRRCLKTLRISPPQNGDVALKRGGVMERCGFCLADALADAVEVPLHLHKRIATTTRIRIPHSQLRDS